MTLAIVWTYTAPRRAAMTWTTICVVARSSLMRRYPFPWIVQLLSRPTRMTVLTMVLRTSPGTEMNLIQDLSLSEWGLVCWEPLGFEDLGIFENGISMFLNKTDEMEMT